VLCRLEDVLPVRILDYLDLAIAEALWDEHDLSKPFRAAGTNSSVSTPLVAKVLTLNRCICPTSHYAIEDWLGHTALPEMLAFDPKKFNDDKLYYELDKICASKRALENHLFSSTYRRDPQSYDFVNYDLSTSYFVGVRCKLSRFGRSKDGRKDKKQVVLGVLINNDGLPFQWDVWPGDTAEVNTLERVVRACRQRFHLKWITLVFDRGLVSDDNLTLIEGKHLKYISALDRDQIANVPEIPLHLFQDLQPEGLEKQVAALPDFERYDDQQVFRDLGTLGQQRYVLGFNPALFVSERKTREAKVRVFDAFLEKLNDELAQAQRSRKLGPTRRKVDAELKRLKLSGLYGKPEFKRIVIRRKPRPDKKGSDRAKPKAIRSYRVCIEQDRKEMRADSLLDGVCVFVSNHRETRPDGAYVMPARQIIWAYRNKTQIEDVFKHVKSFLKLRPFFVNTDEHVVAVYTMCVLGYFLNQVLAMRRQRIEGKDYLNTKKLYSPFESCRLTEFSAENSDRVVKKLVRRTSEQQRLLRELGLSHLETPTWLKD